jgi:ANTAR domain
MRAADSSVDGRLGGLFAQAQAARERSQLLAGQLQAAKRRTSENWQLIQAAWGETERIRARRLAARSDRLRYSAYARLQARLVSMPVIEQAKGIIMAKYGWSEDQAFDALRRASQRENVKVRDLAATIVARAAHPGSAQRRGRIETPGGPWWLPSIGIAGRQPSSSAGSRASATRHPGRHRPALPTSSARGSLATEQDPAHRTA